MARSRRGARAFRRNAQLQGRFSNNRNIRDWLVGGDTVDSTGAPQAIGAATTTWSSGTTNSTALAAGASMGYLAAQILPSPSSSTPTVGKLRVNAIKGRIDATPSASSGVGQLSVAVGIFVAELNNTTTLWSMRNVSSPSDAARDDYLYLDMQTICTSATGQSGMSRLEFLLTLSSPVVLGGGQALMVAIALPPGGIGAFINSAFRVSVGPVA